MLLSLEFSAAQAWIALFSSSNASLNLSIFFFFFTWSVGACYRRRRANRATTIASAGAAFARQFRADPLARVVDRGALSGRVGGRRNRYIRTRRTAGRHPSERADAVHALVVDDDDLAGVHVAHEVGADDVERAGLTGPRPGGVAVGMADAAEDERAIRRLCYVCFA